MRPERLALAANGLWLVAAGGAVALVIGFGTGWATLVAVLAMLAAAAAGVTVLGRASARDAAARLDRLAAAMGLKAEMAGRWRIEDLIAALAGRLARANRTLATRGATPIGEAGASAPAEALPIVSTRAPIMAPASGTHGAAEMRLARGGPLSGDEAAGSGRPAGHRPGGSARGAAPGADGGEGMESEFALSDDAFERVRQRVYGMAGISLSDAKRTLVISRLSKTLRRLGFTAFDDYLDFLDAGAPAEEVQGFVNALTTNLTRFFREEHHFDHLGQHVAAIVARRTQSGAGPGRLRLWSAGCSSGQEPYTIALHLTAMLPELRRWDFRILATDIDTQVLARAAAGIYPESELSGLSPERASLFGRMGDGTIRVPEAARRLVAFKPLNLMDAPWPMKGPFDAIFCRNVAIYFDRTTQGRLFGRLGDMLTPEGCLYIGHSENLGAASGRFRNLGRTMFQMQPQVCPQDRAAAKPRNAA
jgi:chemotaxis protein methyltransferase CheR